MRPVVSVSTLKWFIRYIYYWTVQILHNVIIAKSSATPPCMGDLGRFWLSCFGPLVFLHLKTFE
jgi:hypothetical protein